MTRFLAIGATLAAIAATSTHAAQNMAHMKMPSAQPQKKVAAEKTGRATGTVKAINKASGTITLQHGPVPELGWPGMTMAFKATPRALLDKVRVGQRVDATIRVGASGSEVTALGPVR